MNNEQQILVAIQCLVYNHEPYLRQCLDGFIMQKTNFKFVAIVHDDCSTDNSANIIKEYEQKFPDIIKPIYETENQYSKGGFGHLQTIMEMACDNVGAKYIALCEGDDYWIDSYKLQKQIDILENKNNLIGVYTNRCLVDNIGNIIEKSDSKIIPNKECITYSMRDFFRNQPSIPTASVVYRAQPKEEILNKMQYVTNDYLGDWTLWIILLCYGDLYFLDEVSCAYRINPKSITHTYDRVGRIKASYEICKKVADVLPEQYADISDDLRDKSWLYMPIAHAYRKEHKYVYAVFYSIISFFANPSMTIKWLFNILRRFVG